MLSWPVIEAVAQGRFHIHAVSSAGEGMALLCGLPFGVLGRDGYPANTLLGRVQATLRAYRQACEALGHEHPRRRTAKARAAAQPQGLSAHALQGPRA
jgi:hypothetical protein